MRVVALAAVVGLACASCATTPPPRWAEGGSPIELPRARWERNGQTVDIMPDGRVLVDGVHAFSLDQAGRIVDNDTSPIGVLGPDGKVVGTDKAPLGSVGMRNAAPPKTQYAWFSIGEAGEVVRYDADGGEVPDGKWTGCGTAIRTCTLATQVVTLAEYRNRKSHTQYVRPGPTVGFTVNGMVVVP